MQPVKTITRFEGFLEGMIERSFARLFGARMQPVEIAKRLTREMEAGRVVGVSSILVPNLYNVALSDEDYAPFAPIRASLEAEMSRYLQDFARSHGYMTTAPPEVHIAPDSTLRRRALVVAGQLTEPPPDALPPTERLDRTQMMPQAPVAAMPAPQGLPGEASLRVNNTSYPLSGTELTLGRGLENTIVFEDGRVSRNHARLSQQNGYWTIRDEGSTNGTFVNGRMVTQYTLKNGDRLSLGGLELVFEQQGGSP